MRELLKDVGILGGCNFIGLGFLYIICDAPLWPWLILWIIFTTLGVISLR